MAKVFNCPNCDAPLPIVEGKTVVQCSYCKVPIKLTTSGAPAAAPPVGDRPVARPAVTGVGAGRSKHSLVGVLAGAVILTGVGVGAFLLAGESGDSKRRSATPVVKKVPPMPDMGRLVTTDDFNGDGVGDILFVSYGSRKQDGTVTCEGGLLDGVSGRPVWQQVYPGHTVATVGRCNDLLIFQDRDFRVIAVDARSGKRRWRGSILSDFLAESHGAKIVAAGGAETPVCLYPTRDNKLYALDGKSGKKLWAREAEGEESKPVAFGDALYFRNTAQLLGAVDGAPRADDRRIYTTPSVVQDRLYLVASGEVLVLDARARLLATIPIPESSSRHVSYKPKQYAQGNLLVLRWRDGRIGLVKGTEFVGPIRPPEGLVWANAKVVGDTLLVMYRTKVGTARSSLVAYDAQLEQRWRLALAGLDRRYAMPGWNPPQRTGWKVDAFGKRVFVELGRGSDNTTRLGVYALESGKLVKKVALPTKDGEQDYTRIEWLRVGPKRAFIHYETAGGLIAIDSSSARVAWMLGLP